MHVSSNDALRELVSKNFCCASPKSAPCKKTCFKVRGSLQEAHIGRYSPFKRKEWVKYEWPVDVALVSSGSVPVVVDFRRRSPKSMVSTLASSEANVSSSH